MKAKAKRRKRSAPKMHTKRTLAAAVRALPPAPPPLDLPVDVPFGDEWPVVP